MKAIIIEDEYAAVENLSYYLKQISPEIRIVEVIDTVSHAIEFLGKEPVLKLIPEINRKKSQE